VVVPGGNLIVEENRAFGYAMGALDGPPISARRSSASAAGALDAAAHYVVERRASSTTHRRLPGHQFMLGRHGDPGRGPPRGCW